MTLTLSPLSWEKGFCAGSWSIPPPILKPKIKLSPWCSFLISTRSCSTKSKKMTEMLKKGESLEFLMGGSAAYDPVLKGSLCWRQCMSDIFDICVRKKNNFQPPNNRQTDTWHQHTSTLTWNVLNSESHFWCWKPAAVSLIDKTDRRG